MVPLSRDHLIALLEAYLVTFLWSSSYVLVKLGLGQIQPFTLVSLRYVVASAFLIPIALSRGDMSLISDRRTLTKMVFLGLSGYTIAQGLQCLGLYYLPAVSVTFILNFTPVIVLILGVLFLKDNPGPLQLTGMAIVMAGAYLYFNAPLTSDSPLGILITLASGLGWASYIVSTRLLFRDGEVGPLELTASSMGIGTLVLVLSAFALEGFPRVPPSGWAIITWLGVVNTALAFFLWNHALQRLKAFEMSVLQNTMLVQIAILAWLFLGEQLTAMKLTTMAMVFIGALIVQLRR
jgi:drug/metabolite transporter (DMT)-like permease